MISIFEAKIVLKTSQCWTTVSNIRHPACYNYSKRPSRTKPLPRQPQPIILTLCPKRPCPMPIKTMFKPKISSRYFALSIKHIFQPSHAIIITTIRCTISGNSGLIPDICASLDIVQNIVDPVNVKITQASFWLPICTVRPVNLASRTPPGITLVELATGSFHVLG